MGVKKLFRIIFPYFLGFLLTIFFPAIATWALSYFFGESAYNLKAGEIPSGKFIDYTYWPMIILFLVLLCLGYFIKAYTEKYYKAVFALCLLLPLSLYAWLITDMFSTPRLIVELNLSVMRGDAIRVERLLNWGADSNAVFINESNPNEYSPIIFAAGNNNLEVVNILLGHGADVNYKSKNGMDARSLAESKGHLEVANALSVKN